MLNLTESTFEEEVLDAEGTVLIDCWANWCPPCRAYAPTFEKVAKEFPDVKFAKLNIDDNQAMAQEFRISAIPATMLFQNGELVRIWSGMLSEGTLRDIVEDAVDS